VNHLKRAVAAVAVFAGLCVAAWAVEAKPESTNDAQARAVYDSMIEALKTAETLSYESACTTERPDGTRERSLLKVQLKKPAFVRVEESIDGKVAAILAGGSEAWYVYWPGGRPQQPWEAKGDYRAKWEKTKDGSFMKTARPIGQRSIAGAILVFRPNGTLVVIEPGIFTGVQDYTASYIDGAMLAGSETIGGEECDVIRLSLLKGMIEQKLWISRRDHLPRRLIQTANEQRKSVTEEIWSNVIVNGAMGDKEFAWSPPEGWQEFQMLGSEEVLLAVGAEAPDFDLASWDGKRIHLADYRGKAVWFIVWRAG
jgi:outer membrane lipoprotein-sorting protein